MAVSANRTSLVVVRGANQGGGGGGGGNERAANAKGQSGAAVGTGGGNAIATEWREKINGRGHALAALPHYQ